ncbi:MAG: hypothetical protein ACE5GX_19235 [Thermoanaerobaculia bacterium]
MKDYLSIAVILAIVGPSALGAETKGPVTGSPGGLSKVVPSVGICPIFIWGATEADDLYELAVYEVGEFNEPTRDPVPVVTETIPAPLTAWVPDGERCLRPGRSYAWVVRALQDASPGPWSEPRMFRPVLPAEVLQSRSQEPPVRVMHQVHEVGRTVSAESNGQPVAEGPSPAPGPATGIAIEGEWVIRGWQPVSFPTSCIPGCTFTVSLPCAVGLKVLGGGVTSSPGGLTVRFSGPNSLATGWNVQVANESANSIDFTTWAICARID